MQAISVNEIRCYKTPSRRQVLFETLNWCIKLWNIIPKCPPSYQPGTWPRHQVARCLWTAVGNALLEFFSAAPPFVTWTPRPAPSRQTSHIMHCINSDPGPWYKWLQVQHAFVFTLRSGGSFPFGKSGDSPFYFPDWEKNVKIFPVWEIKWSFFICLSILPGG